MQNERLSKAHASYVTRYVRLSAFKPLLVLLSKNIRVHFINVPAIRFRIIRPAGYSRCTLLALFMYLLLCGELANGVYTL